MLRVPGLASMVEGSAAPAAVEVALDRLADAGDGVAERLADDHELCRALVVVTAASRSLTELLVSDAEALDVLAELDRRPVLTGDDVAAVKRWKSLEMLRIAGRDLVGRDDLPAVGSGLAALASEVLDASCRIAGGPEGLAVVGMGKLGGAELNYSSDIDIMFVGDGSPDDARLARTVLDAARTCFRVDVDLRPEGRDGPLVRTLASYESYWERWAKTWEFQALIKAHPVAGDVVLGARFAQSARDALWGRPFTAEDLRAVRHMKARSEGELRRRHLLDREVKRGHGGIRDVEFSVQLLQLVHGHSDPGLRGRTTIDVLAELGNSGYVEPDDARTLDRAYRFLRTVEHRLQLVQEQQVHTLPSDPAAFDRLARVMGHRDSAEGTAGDLLNEDLRRQRAAVRAIHEHLFFRPLLDTLTSSGTVRMPSEAVADRLAAFGFTDADRTRAALEELTRGLTRSSRLMTQMLPLLLAWLSESPDADAGLLGLRRLADGTQRTTELATAFRESPEAARNLCMVLGTSRRLADSLERHPDVIPLLGKTDELASHNREAMDKAAHAASGWRPGVAERQVALRRFKRREELLVAAGDVLDAAGPGDVQVALTARQLTSLAETCVRTALDALQSSLPVCVMAMGRLGGSDLSYASDLDLLVVYEGSTAADAEGANKVAEGLLRFLGGSTPADRIYAVDFGLRPEGKNGPLARSLDGYRAYYERWSQVWERQALVRARPVAGDDDLGRAFALLVDEHVWGSGVTDADVREMRRIKARVEKERVPAGEDPQFHLKLGPGSLSDVEFCTQLLQLRHGVRGTATLDALDELAARDVLAGDDRDVLANAYRFCERTRNRLFLVRGSSSDSLPSRPETLAPLARSLGTTSFDLREQYRRVTRRSRQVVERLFYGRSEPDPIINGGGR